MSDIKKINDLYEDVYKGLNDKLSEKGNYSVKLFKQPPNNSYLPNVQMVNRNKYLGYETLDYSQRKYPIEYHIEIYAQTVNGVSKFEISDKLECVIADYMDERGLKLMRSNPIVNLDTNIQRTLMRFTALYDIDSDTIIKY